MTFLSSRILEATKELSEGAPIAAKGLLHLGKRAAIDQALSRLTQRGKLIRARRGLYLRPVESRFGSRAPAAEKVVEQARLRSGETIVSSGAAAANRLGLTTQVPVREIYLTSGPSCAFRLGKQVVEFRHVPRWQLTSPQGRVGEVVRALAWLGPGAAERTLRIVGPKLTPTEVSELRSAAASLPGWLAKPVSELNAG